MSTLAEAPAHQAVTPIGVVKEGLVTKQGGRIKTWKKRWCVLAENGLLYYKTQQNPSLRYSNMQGQIELSSIQTVEVNPEKLKQKSCFRIITPGRTFVISANDDADMEDWIREIKKMVEKAKSAPPKKEPEADSSKSLEELEASLTGLEEDLKAEINQHVENCLKEKDSLIDELIAREILEVRAKYVEIEVSLVVISFLLFVLNEERYFEVGGNWTNEEDQRKFLDNFAIKYGIKEPKQWGTVSHSTIKKENGRGLLYQYEGSLFLTLKEVYPNIDWKSEWFPYLYRQPNGHWSRENQRNFLIHFAKKNGIHKPSDWGKVYNREVVEQGGTWLYKYYGALKNALLFLFPEIPWKLQWFQYIHKNPSGYWKDKNNQKIFLESLMKQFNITSDEMWGKITNRQVVAAGGSTLIAKYGSLHKALQQLYPNIEWKKEWFPTITKFPLTFWNTESNQRQFLDTVANQFGILRPSDWCRVTMSLIRGQGGQGLLSRYNNSLFRALERLYPHQEWGIKVYISTPHQRVNNHLRVLFP